MRSSRCLLLAVFAVLLIWAPNASAMLIPSGGEPAFTKGTSNTWCFTWNRDGTTTYRVCFTEYIDGVSQGFNTDGCVSPNGTGGTVSKAHSSLSSGHKYEVCAEAQTNDLGLPQWTTIPGDS